MQPPSKVGHLVCQDKRVDKGSMEIESSNVKFFKILVGLKYERLLNYIDGRTT